MDYLQMSARRNILRAHRRFKQEMLRADKNTIWNHSEKISFVGRAVEYYLHSENIPEVFYQMAVAEPALLDMMYRVYEKEMDSSGNPSYDFDKLLELVLINWGVDAA